MKSLTMSSSLRCVHQYHRLQNAHLSMRHVVCIGRKDLSNKHRNFSTAYLINTRRLIQWPSNTNGQIISGKNPSRLKYLTSRHLVQTRKINSSEPDSKSQLSSRLKSILEEIKSGILYIPRVIINDIKYTYNSISQLSFQDLYVTISRILAFIGTVHVTSEYGFRTIACEGVSMEPTIMDGSFTVLLVERWSHRLFGLESGYYVDSEMYQNENVKSNNSGQQNDSFQNTIQEWSTIVKGIWKQHFTSGLQRGDVIILYHPQREGTVCKRIIGMPGDIIVRSDGGSEETNHRVAIPPGHFWIEGDNTCNSLDSRSYGAVPASLTIGKVVCRLWPLREYVWVGMDGNGMHRWKRIGARIGRGERPLDVVDGMRFSGSHVLGVKR